MKSRHDYLLAAGWQHDPATDRYAPKGGDDWLDIDRAWAVYSVGNPQAPAKFAQPRDPRWKEPE